jgi:hypothetical protein
MTPKGTPRKDTEQNVKTTIDLPQALWRAAKLRAMDERRDLRSMVIEALRAYLRTPRGGA